MNQERLEQEISLRPSAAQYSAVVLPWSTGQSFDNPKVILGLDQPIMLFLFLFLISSFLYAAKGYDNYKQIIMGLAGHIAMQPPNHL